MDEDFSISSHGGADIMKKMPHSSPKNLIPSQPSPYNYKNITSILLVFKSDLINFNSQSFSEKNLMIKRSDLLQNPDDLNSQTPIPSLNIQRTHTSDQNSLDKELHSFMENYHKEPKDDELYFF